MALNQYRQQQHVYRVDSQGTKLFAWHPEFHSTVSGIQENINFIKL